MKQLADRLGWTLHTIEEDGKDSPEGTPFEIIWLSVDQSSAIHWIEDQLLQVRYIAITGPTRRNTEGLLRDSMEFHTTDSTVDLFDGTRDFDALTNAVRALSIQCQGPYDAKLFALLRWSAHDPHPIVRRVAMLVASTIKWPEIEPLVEYVQEHDLDETVRAESAEVLKIIRDRATRADSTYDTDNE
ncbi:HEAT repeat domain-containing protein [Streptomyces sp. NEAU-S77]|uniref:HEAT repeat domain-containing protein n=1 Tax=Streptomyces sp. NEAU-S77 TaxID=3411033 RepID=UPI003B9E312D